MITQELLTPASIVVVGGSKDIQKPGGKVLKNLLDHGFKGDLYVVNSKSNRVQGVQTFRTVDALPPVDLAILAIPAVVCPAAITVLAKRKATKAFIVLSAGFHEIGASGAALEEQLVQAANDAGACLIGPNCIGMLTTHYAGIFTTPVPTLSPDGVDFITGSGATAVFILDAAIQNGLRFSSVYSVGNSAQTGVEDVLEYLDLTYREGKSARVKMLYIEHIGNPKKLLKHASSLLRKGARIAAIKAGSSEAGSRAASSHTGAMASPDMAVKALFRKAGIIRCYSRTELINVASVLMHPLPTGKNIAIITHAGGPAVMMTDMLSYDGINVPPIEDNKAQELLAKLHPGSSVTNPIDFLATGTAEQLDAILDACRNDFKNIDATAVIFGNPGLARVFDVYDVIDKHTRLSAKPIYAIMPTVINSREEITAFINKGHVCFPDEVIFAHALAKVINTKGYQCEDTKGNKQEEFIDRHAIRTIIEHAGNGYLSPEKTMILLDAAGIPRVDEIIVTSPDEAVKAIDRLKFPIAMKVVGPVHKSDVGGVTLDIFSKIVVRNEFNRMIRIPGATAVLLQPMLNGLQLFIGAKRETPFGHTILCGMGGIFVEALHDVSAGLSPIFLDEAEDMIRRLRGYKILQGLRGKKPIHIALLAEIVTRVSALCETAPEIAEIDLNPLLGDTKRIIAVDARIRIEHA
ncbi:MAG: acetate--CoA ligase family protein [Prevotellaceae bacterium]|jgi:acetyltransferase|nr:acetate--CoA ligase family protein [Prevotellaceae bacterium]